MNKTVLYYLNVFLFSAFSIQAYSQDPWVKDSLPVIEAKISKAKGEKNFSKALNLYFASDAQVNRYWGSKEDFEKIKKFFQDGLQFAEAVSNDKYIVFGNIYLAKLLRKQSEFENARRYILSALERSEKILSDSLTALSLIELGDWNVTRLNPLEASKNFTRAYEWAIKLEDGKLESLVCHRLANLYKNAGDTDEAKRQIYKSIAVNNKHNDGAGLVNDYTILGAATSNDLYLDTVFYYAKKFGLENKTFSAKNILLAIYAFVQKNPRKAIQFIESNSDVKNDIENIGKGNYFWYMGMIYRYGGMPDSALFYLNKAEQPMIKFMSSSYLPYLYLDMAISYQLKKDWRTAIKYYEKVFEGANQFSYYSLLGQAADSLSVLYGIIGNYQKGYDYKFSATKVNDSIALSAKQKDLVLLDLTRERTKQEDEARQEKERIHRKHNLQYMGITTGISIVLFIFLMLGTFKASKTVIRIFGFVYFICLFEFVILLIDHSIIIPLTHEDPLKIWLMKIAILIVLVPVQQFIEHRLIHFVQSGAFLQFKQKFRTVRKNALRIQNREQPVAVASTETLANSNIGEDLVITTGIEEFFEPDKNIVNEILVPMHSFRENTENNEIKTEQLPENQLERNQLEIEAINEKLELINAKLSLLKQDIKKSSEDSAEKTGDANNKVQK